VFAVIHLWEQIQDAYPVSRQQTENNVYKSDQPLPFLYKMAHEKLQQTGWCSRSSASNTACMSACFKFIATSSGLCKSWDGQFTSVLLHSSKHFTTSRCPAQQAHHNGVQPCKLTGFTFIRGSASSVCTRSVFLLSAAMCSGDTFSLFGWLTSMSCVDFSRTCTTSVCFCSYHLCVPLFDRQKQSRLALFRQMLHIQSFFI
jgi:hypothetical protein